MLRKFGDISYMYVTAGGCASHHIEHSENVTAKNGWATGKPFTVKCLQGYTAKPKSGSVICEESLWANPSTCSGELVFLTINTHPIKTQ